MKLSVIFHTIHRWILWLAVGLLTQGLTFQHSHGEYFEQYFEWLYK